MAAREAEVVVIGAGPAGIEAARAAAEAGAAVILVGDGRIGGRAGWHSLLPSKVWLEAAGALASVQEASRLGAAAASGEADPETILQRIREVATRWSDAQQQRLADLGVHILEGRAAFAPSGGERPLVRVYLQEEDEQAQAVTLQAERIIIAAGSVPIFPPGMKPNGRYILAPRFASHLKRLPPSIAVVGAGATGSEFAYLFNRLGVQVTWIVDQFGVLPDFIPEAGRFLADTLRRRGVRLVEGQPAQAIEETAGGIAVGLEDGSRYEAAIAFMAIGRRPDLDRFELEEAGVDLEALRALDGYGQSGLAGVYLVGDAAGAPMVANRAMAQARVAGRHAAGAPVQPYEPAHTVAAIYSEPEIAQIGRLRGEGVQTARLPYSATLKGQLLATADGFLELAYAARDGRLLGGAAAGPQASGLLTPLAVALQAGTRVGELAALYPAHPTLNELPFAAAREAVARGAA